MNGSLPTREVEKPWGREDLPAPFHSPVGRRIGEIWFEPPPELPELLVKYIFTSEKLSVQVHPSDEQLPGHGKEECWLVVDAEPNASLGIGFHEPLGRDALREAAIHGQIEQLLEWHSVRPGDFFFIPAGTVHAIGAGVSLIEVQQNSDITYRLYDYGRPRELHLDEAVVVARGEPYDEKLRRWVPPRGSAALVDGPLFRLNQVEGAPGNALAALYGSNPLLVIPREGPVHIAGREITTGGCGLALDIGEVEFASSGVCLLAQPCGP
ncbi:MAG: class I mannose-6-phosphate isomerase [Novosphingobium sp.]|nr:class I mannose-6-phosphate isomerase [Novosphingobium sp.]